jgi:hypothetical protein
MTKVFKFFGGRKYFCTLLVFIAATVLLVLGKIDAGDWVWASGICLTTYTATNVYDKASTKKMIGSKFKPPQ